MCTTNHTYRSYIPFFGRVRVEGSRAKMAGFLGWSFIALFGFILSLWTIIYLYNDLVIEVDTSLVDSIPLPNVFMCVPAVHRVQGQGVWFGAHYTPRNPLAAWNSEVRSLSYPLHVRLRCVAIRVRCSSPTRLVWAPCA